MADFGDHFEDMAEETDEFEEAFTERMEDLFGFEFKIHSVNHQHNGHINVHLQPIGATDILNEELGDDVEVQDSGTMSFVFRRED